MKERTSFLSRGLDYFLSLSGRVLVFAVPITKSHCVDAMAHSLPQTYLLEGTSSFPFNNPGALHCGTSSLFLDDIISKPCLDL